MPRDSFRCCVISDDGIKRWFVYFDKPRSTMVVTDGMASTYEKMMTTKDRIEFAGNVSESLLEQSWLEMILKGTLKVSEITDDKLILVHVVHRIELNRINDVNVQLKTVDLLEKAVNAHLRLLDRQIRNRIGVEQMAARKTMPNQSNQSKKPEKHENGSASEPSKRRRTRPTGLNFDD
ncbi:hypothetical protein X798_03235 [Onchocerca flexuosa]|uniref:Uncharacterized protein n=2 Tax=Onchocerca flexuosa TaxID=387005 RepID=A0A183H0D5_9BILA|nr:hypothetical protein X798_03235 [Onchocerca flexuosa]VDO27677.1 unnamed protein product [Onchocerca flexuosa]